MKKLFVCVREKVWEKERCMWLSDKDRTEARQGSPQTDDQKETFTLNSNRPVSGAGSGIVAGPDRVRRGLEGETGGGWEQGPSRPLGSWGARGWGGSGGREGRYWQIFMGCRCSICRCLIELCDDELVPLLICIRTIPGSGSGVSGVPPDEMSSRLQTPLRTCELEVDFIQWQGYWLI